MLQGLPAAACPDPAVRDALSRMGDEWARYPMFTDLVPPEYRLGGNGYTHSILHYERVLDEGLEASVRLSHRYIPARQLPDKSVSLLDTACARVAISQHAVLDFFDGEPVTLNERGYIAADPRSFETAVSGVYAGGDVVNDGPSSIVEAAADGKAIARSIGRARTDGNGAAGVAAFDTADLLLRRSRREWRVPVPHSPPANRRNFDEVVKAYDEGAARSEAARCLLCAMCSSCAACTDLFSPRYFQPRLVRPGSGPRAGSRRPRLACAADPTIIGPSCVPQPVTTPRS